MAFFRRRLSAITILSLLSANAVMVAAPTAPAAAAPQLRTSEQFGKPMSEAVTLVKSRRFNEALAKVNQAAPLAKSQAEKLSVEQMRTAIYSGLGRTPELIKSIEAQLAIGGLPAGTIRAHRLTLAGLYGKVNNDAKAVELTKAYIGDYGGTADQYAFVAGYDLKRKRYPEAVKSAKQAIETARRSGQKPKEAWWQIVMTSEYSRGGMPAYYDAVEQTVVDYPKPEYFRVLIERASNAPRFNDSLHKLDIYRALDAAGVAMTPAEEADMGERAYTRGLPWEAVKAMQSPASRSFAGLDPAKAARYEKMNQQIVIEAKQRVDDRAESVRASGRAQSLIVLGEAYTSTGNQDAAIESIEQALKSSDLNADERDYANLQLGIAQFRSGKIEPARNTWSEIKSDNGAADLARAWRMISTVRR